MPLKNKKEVANYTQKIIPAVAGIIYFWEFMVN